MALTVDPVLCFFDEGSEMGPWEKPHPDGATSRQLKIAAVDSHIIHADVDGSDPAKNTTTSTMQLHTVLPESQGNNPRTRKGHKKSRGGCFNCKRRKIKCHENHPACHNCMRINIPCTYPILHGKASSPVPLETRSLQSTPTVFTSSDMRLFHHFIINAYPHLPLGNESVWVRDIPSFSHSYDFLLHAMLSLSAAHLTVTSTSPLYYSVLSYRCLAISGLNRALSTAPENKADADAILATCLILTVIAMYMGDSVEEFFTMMRGINLVFRQNWAKKYGTAFSNLQIGAQEEIIGARLKDFPLLPESLVAEARDSIEMMQGLEMRESERELCNLQAEMVRAMSVSSFEAYLKFRDLQYAISASSSMEFQAFTDPSNTVAQIIIAHYVALLVLMAPIKSREWAGRNMGTVNRHTVFKLEGIWNNIPEGMRDFVYWPMKATGSIPGALPYLKIIYSSEEGLFNGLQDE